MTEPHVVTGLMTKRAELAGMLEHHHAKVRQLMIDLDAIDLRHHRLKGVIRSVKGLGDRIAWEVN